MSEIVYDFIEAPLFEGSSSTGTELSYQYLKKKIVLKANYSFVDYKQFAERNETSDSFSTKNINPVLTKCENIHLSILKSFNNNHFPIIIGGDHSVAMASIAAGSETFGIDDYAVIYVDGHCDINTEESSTSHNIHGMPLASSLGLCHKTLQVGPLKRKIYGDNLYILGARSIDAPEYKIN